MKRMSLQQIIGFVLFITGTQCMSCISVCIPDLHAAPEQVAIDGRNYAMTTFLWRDFMPPVPPGGKPLIAKISIKIKDAADIPPGISATEMWVFNGEDVWKTPLAEDAGSASPSTLSRIARNGPKWEPGIYVDVVVKMVDGKDRSYLLQAKHQLIERTQ